MSDIEIFHCFLIGIVKLLKQDHSYPYPDFFRRACNQLALHVEAEKYPRTIAGLLRLFEQPITVWYPFQVPPTFDSEFGFMYEGRLSEEASRYFYSELLESASLSEAASDLTQQLASEHYQFQKLFSRLRENYLSDPEGVQQDYVLFRTFLIENPYTTVPVLRKTFSGRRMKYIDAQEAGGLYDLCSDSMVYWNCDRCGPLTKKYQHLYGNKPSVCDDHRLSLPFVHRMEGTKELLRIKRGIHLRICLPGIPELSLLRRLEEVAVGSCKHLRSVALYPGLDRYDLHLKFSDDAVWAIDVKDYRNPYKLAKKLPPIYGEGSLKYEIGFYVIPEARTRQYTNYIQIVRENSKLPSHIRIMDELQFESHVIKKINLLKLGSKDDETR